ncbi:hypothetical protein FACS1894110_15500 [Spirochaetia bacterium]|nr:hypothetical protein FACS1894110_15500 [Spirochaetia bacterium]
MILALAALFYGLVPIAGALINRRSWRIFRRRFNDLRLQPLLDYGIYSRLEGGIYRFIGGFESVTDGHTLWIRSDTLTIPVALAGAQTYMLPMQEGGFLPGAFDPGEEAPERIRWDRVSTLTEGAKVFVGGALILRDNRWTFVSTAEAPLMVIFYDGPDRSLAIRAIRAGRHQNEYWNSITPYSLVLGALSLIFIAVSFLPRPAFHRTAITAFAAAFIPLFPMVPPGLLFAVIYRRLWWRARIFRAYRDLARLPLKYLKPGEERTSLPDGEKYGFVRYDSLPPEARAKGIPLLIPEEEKSKKAEWYVFGALQEPDLPAEPRVPLEPRFPAEPLDSFATFGALPGNPEDLARRYARKAYTFELIAWLLLLASVGLNAFFIALIIFLI